MAETQILWRWGQRLPGQIRVLSRQLLFTQPPIDLFQKIVDLEIKNATGLFDEADSALRIRCWAGAELVRRKTILWLARSSPNIQA